MRNIFFIVFIFLNIVELNANSPQKFKISNGLTFIGMGDYRGYYYANALLLPLNQWFYIEPSLGFIISSNSKKHNELRWHNSSYINMDLSLFLKPIATKHFEFLIGGGFASRIRNEINPYFWQSRIDSLGNEYFYNIVYENNTTFDIGYTISTYFIYVTPSKFDISFNLIMNTYKAGTEIFIFDLSLYYKF
jgi:hypothetical protein